MNLSARSEILLIIVGLVAAAFIAIAASINPLFSAIVLTPLLIPLICTPTGRLLVFVVGTFAVFSASQGVSNAKVAFLVVVLVTTSVAAFRSVRHVREDWARPFRFALLGSLGVFVLITISGITGLVEGASISLVLRDSVTYFIIVAAVPLGLDAGSVISRSRADFFVVGVSLFAAASFLTAVLANRGVSNLSVDRFGLPSMMALSIGVGVGAVKALESGRIRWRWFLFAAVLIGAVLASGSREGLVLLLGAGGSLGIAIQRRAGFFRVLFGAAVTVLGIVGALYLASRTVTNQAFLQSRITASIDFLSHGSSADSSALIRNQASAIAIGDWSPHPLFGVGLGHVFANPNPGAPPADFQLDTPATYLTKFGIVGCVILITSILAMLSPALMKSRGSHRTSEQIAMLAAATVWLGQLYFGSPTEDKGFALAVLLGLVGIAGSKRAIATGGGF